MLEQGEAEVSLDLGAVERRVAVAGVLDDHVGGAQGAAESADARDDLLEDPVIPADLRAIREEPDLLHDHVSPSRRAGQGRLSQTELTHDVTVDPLAETLEEGAEPLARVRLGEPLVGIEPEDPTPGGQP